MKKFLTVIGILSLVLVLLLASLGVWAYYRFIYTEPLSPSEVAEVSVDWDIVTHGNWSPWHDTGDGAGLQWNPAVSYNEWVAGIPEEDKAWPLMVDIESDHRDFFVSKEFIYFAGSLPSDTEEWALYKPVLTTDRADEILDRTIVAFNKPYVGLVWSNDNDPYEHAALRKAAITDPEIFDPGPLQFDPLENYSMIEMLLPHLGRHRQLVNFTRSKAALELEQGESERFVETMEAMLRSTELEKEMPVLINQLVEIAIESVTIRTIDWGVSTHTDRFDEAQLVRLEQALAAYVNPEYAWEGEALMMHDTIRRLCDENGNLSFSSVRSFNSNFGVGLLSNPTSLPDDQLGAAPQRTLYVYNKMLRHASAQDSLQWDGTHEHTTDVLEGERDQLNFLSAMFLDIMIPALDRPGSSVRRLKQETVGVRLGIAAERHRLRHGAYPESIDDIDDDLITFDPIDAFSGEQLRYILSDRGPVIYSVGPDRIDNGGQQGWETKTGWDGEPYRTKVKIEWITLEGAESFKDQPDAQYDWVLYPMPPDENETIEEDWDQDWVEDWDGDTDAPAEPDAPEAPEETTSEESEG